MAPDPARSRVGGSGTLQPQSLPCPKHPPPSCWLSQLPCAKVSDPSRGTMRFSRAVPACLLWLPPTRLCRLGTVGAALSPRLGDPPFPLRTPARGLIAAVLQANSRPSRPAIAHLHRESEKDDVLFPVTQPGTEPTSPCPTPELRAENLLPSSQKPSEKGTFQTEAFAKC